MAERNLKFDEVIDRRGTDCLKYDFAVRRGYPADVLPLWVADMDFRISSYIQDALGRQLEHGIYGYTDTLEDYAQALDGWTRKHYGYGVKEKEIIKTPGVVPAIGLAIQAFTRPGDAVLIQQPVYYPFSSVVRDSGRKIVSSDLVYDRKAGSYHVDFEDFEKKIEETQVKLFLLCNPHNPVGKAWSKEDLAKMGEICRKHGVLVFSDEIHADFVWKGRHQAFFTAVPGAEDFCVTATSPCKTFNISGLQISNIIIKNVELRARFQKALDAIGYSQVGAPGIAACKAAYRDGEEWYEAVRTYIQGNLDFMEDYRRENIPQLKMIRPEATYLVWVDCNGLGFTNQELDERIIQKAKLWLDSGKIFGKTGRGFERFNVACPRATLTEALQRLQRAFILS